MEKTKPIHKIRIGKVAAAIWENKTEGGTYYNVTISRFYRDGENVKSSDSFGRDDLLLVAKVADMAFLWIYENGNTNGS